MFNHITLIGRLTRNPELRYAQSGFPVCSFSVAYQRDYKSADGERATDFITIVAWRSTAEFVSKYFSKGLAVVDGRLQFRDWTDRVVTIVAMQRSSLTASTSATAAPQNQVSPVPAYSGSSVALGES